MDQLWAYWAYRKLREARLAEIQNGGKAVTRAEEQKLKLKVLQSPKIEDNLISHDSVPSPSDDPVPSTSRGVTGPPLPKAYKKTAKKNIVSICHFGQIFLVICIWSC